MHPHKRTYSLGNGILIYATGRERTNRLIRCTNRDRSNSDWGFVRKLLLKLLPKLVLTTKDDEWWLDDAVVVLEKAAELMGLYVAVDSNIFKNEKLRTKIQLFYENEVLYSQISVSFWQNITFLMIFATIFKI